MVTLYTPECDVVHDRVRVLHGVEGGLVAPPLGHRVQVVPLRASRVDLLGHAELLSGGVGDSRDGAVGVADVAEDLWRGVTINYSVS